MSASELNLRRQGCNITTTVTRPFPATVTAAVNWCRFLGYYLISVTVTINFNHTDVEGGKCATGK